MIAVGGNGGACPLRQRHPRSAGPAAALEIINKFVYIETVKSAEFKRWLADQGATFKPAKGSHLKVYLNGGQSILPMHNKELGKGLVETIRKQLRLK